MTTTTEKLHEVGRAICSSTYFQAMDSYIIAMLLYRTPWFRPTFSEPAEGTVGGVYLTSGKVINEPGCGRSLLHSDGLRAARGQGPVSDKTCWYHRLSKARRTHFI